MHTSFPQELIGTIAECLTKDSDRHVLRNLALTSRATRVEAQRVLFRTFDFPDDLGDEIDRRKPLDIVNQNLSFLRAILNAPNRLGSYVRTYTSWWISTAPRPSSGQLKHSPEGMIVGAIFADSAVCRESMELWNLTIDALPFLSGLRHLTFAAKVEGHVSKPPLAKVVELCGSPSLRTICVGSTSDPSALATGVFRRQLELTSFTVANEKNEMRHYEEMYSPQKPDIRHLELTRSPPLTHVKAPANIILALLKLQEIDVISWEVTLQEGSNGKVQVALQEEMADVLSHCRTKHLCLSYSLDLKKIAARLACVEILSLQECDGSWVRAVSALGELKSLRVLILGYNYDFYYDEEEIRSELLTLAFDSCPTLQCVLVEGVDPWMYRPIERSDAWEEGYYDQDGDLDITRVVKAFKPWMPRALPNPRFVSCYM